jgi:hypothetical protein
MNGDEKSLYESVGIMNTLISYADQIKGTTDGIVERITKDPNLDEDIVNLYQRDFNTLRENGFEINSDDPTNTTISLKNKEGELMYEQPFTEFIESRKVIPRKVDLIDKTKKVLSTIKPSVTKEGSYAINKEIKDINSEESKSQVEAIKANVDTWVSNDDFMWSFYKKEMAKDSKLPLKTTAWTQKEIDNAREFYTEYLIDAYNKEVKAGYGRPGSSGGSGGGGNLNVSEVLPLSRVTISDSNNNLIAGKDVKGRIYSTNDAQAGIEVAGKRIKGFYAGNDGSFYFSAADPTSAGYGGVSGRNLGVEWVYPDTKNYGDIVNQAVAAFKNFGVTDEKSLASFLRGENQQINTSGY